MKLAIKVENLSKVYHLGEVGTGTLTRDIERWWALCRGKPDPFLKLGESNDQGTKTKSNVVFSLRDINFEIEQGEAVGIIGRNGAGKSTLLKILSRVTSPTAGVIRLNGRIASLLEVGTGFHPELTGRENIYLNGAILGMRTREISRKLDEIIAFSGVEKYIDTPVKRYSSGMYVRLAFSVAAHLESEVLIVDEVLAVGDAEFQKKCLGKMGDVTKRQGRTVLFVSHNMAAVAALCTSGIVLDRGTIGCTGNIEKAIDFYKSIGKTSDLCNTWNLGYVSNELINVDSVQVTSSDGEFSTDSRILVKIVVCIKKAGINVAMDLRLYNNDDVFVFDVTSAPQMFSEGPVVFVCSIPKHFLNEGNYRMCLDVVQNESSLLFELNDLVSFRIVEGEREVNYFGKWGGVVRPRFNWEIIKC